MATLSIDMDHHVRMTHPTHHSIPDNYWLFGNLRDTNSQ
jgi:hypothetical protein